MKMSELHYFRIVSYGILGLALVFGTVFSTYLKNVNAATETKYASSHITGTFDTPTNAVGSTTGSWAGVLNTNSNYTSRWAMEDPSGTITGTQTVAVLARKGSNSGTPTLSINLYENGSLVQSIVGTTNITSTTGQTVSGTFDASVITNANDVEIEVVETGAGGNPSTRNSAQIDYIRWTVNLQDTTTTLGDGTDPSNSTVAPGSAVTDLDQFTFQTNTGSDTITAVTVTLAPAGAFNNIAKVEITNTSNTDQCTDIDNPASLNLNFTGCSLSAGTSAATYKVRITSKTHANMAAPSSGVSYDVTGTVTDWTGTNTTHAGTDTDSATITIDNLSPANVTSASAASSLEGQVALSWTNPGDTDLLQVVVLRDTSAVSNVPAEGTTYTVGNTIGSATVACATSTSWEITFASCTDTGLSNGTAYHYKLFSKDSRGNYSDAGVTPTGSPVTPAAATFEFAAYRLFDDSTSVTPGTALEAQNTAATLAATGDPFRMRALVHVGSNGISSSGKTFKLQYAPKSGTCDASFAGEEYHDMSATTTVAFFDTAGITDDSALGAQADLTHGGDTIVNQTYEEANTFTNSQGSILSGQDGKWDFSLYDNGGTADAAYCMRLVTDTEETFTTYTVVAEVVMAPAGSPDITLFHYRWRKDNKVETDTSWVESEDALHNSGVFVGDRRRLRFLVSNPGAGPANNITYQLEYASGACSSWTAVPNTESSDPWTMSLSVYLTNNMPTTDNSGLTNPGGSSFVAGFAKAGSNTTSAHTLAAGEFTELEYVVRSTDTVQTDTTYCFRLTNAGSTTNFTYSVTAQISIPNQARPQKSTGTFIESTGTGEPTTGGTDEAAPPPVEEEGTGEPETGGTAGGGGGELE